MMALVEAEAVRQDPQAMRLVPNLTKERALKLFSVNSYVLGYVSSSVGVTKDDLEQTIISVVSQDDIDESYLIGLLTNKTFGGRQATWQIDLLQVIEQHGIRQAKLILIDEFLKY